jgi:hypothetical protein
VLLRQVKNPTAALDYIAGFEGDLAEAINAGAHQVEICQFSH